MNAILSIWWVWVAAGLVLAILETLLPGFILLGFAIGAVLTGLTVAFGLSASAATLSLIFAVLSLIAWLGLRRVFAHKFGTAKTFDHDINDN